MSFNYYYWWLVFNFYSREYYINWWKSFIHSGYLAINFQVISNTYIFFVAWICIVCGSINYIFNVDLISYKNAELSDDVRLWSFELHHNNLGLTIKNTLWMTIIIYYRTNNISVAEILSEIDKEAKWSWCLLHHTHNSKHWLN